MATAPMPPTPASTTPMAARTRPNVRMQSSAAVMVAEAARGMRRFFGPARPEAALLHRLDDVLGHLLGIAQQHHGLVHEEQRIVDAGIARPQRALHEQHGL